ncbi:transglutaminaseTgpA domain-containing protein [Ramlibacter rhizophilus]|uniref:DUF3488 domain-containing protein n=1 Tax=Ramlibacter rhizophilus TaxID=1781167 RepID=A0A4Z0BD47_9BURK|nr:DUF3488 and transglutaminase-like domain-containing protein [Ramlibacter rhizophilus]TFY96571.1 DUF3488 domain-containing protein [Ramlibacter rhizophilus]
MSALRRRIGSLPREGRDTLFLLAVIGWIVLPQAGALPLWCSALVLLVLGWRGWLALSNRSLPRARWLVALLASGMAATALSHGTLLGREAGVTLIVVLLALKTLELRARRDAFVVFFLGFFTLLTNFFHSQSLAIAAAMLVGLLGLLTALVNAHKPVGRPPLAASARTAGVMALMGAPIMLVLFVLFPRFGPLWGIPADAMTGRSGLSASMEVGNVARLALDESIAMRLRFEGPVPERSDLYFRGPVLTRFDGRSWQPLYSGRSAWLTGAGRVAPVRLQGEPLRYQVTMEPNNRPWLLTLDVAGAAPEVPGQRVIGTPELQWLLLQPVTDLLRYEAESYVRWTQGPLGSAAALPLEYRELPPGFNPRTLQLATDLMRESTAPPEDKAALVQAALTRLRTGGYRYTLEPGTFGEHSADEFWFDRREGFCEHIASAFAVLMRAMDIPTRIVTGYQGGERNPIDGYWVLRQSDAHAWVEVWLAGRGWVRVDPTSSVAPGRTGSFQRLQPAPGVLANAVGAVNPALAMTLRSAWEALDNAWKQRVLNYTQSRQLNLLRQLGFQSPSWQDLLQVLVLLLAGAATLGATWAAWERRRQDPWLRLLARARGRMEKCGLVLPPTHGPRQLAAAARTHFGAAADPLADWLLRLEAQRYSRQSQQRLPALRRQFKQLPWPVPR